LLRESADIIVNLTVTDRCYARCKDCINNSLTFKPGACLPSGDRECDPERDSALVLKIAESHPDRPITVCFYGGEPFLALQKMDQVRGLLGQSPLRDRVRYMVYTTGELITEAIMKHQDLVSGIWLYSISVDGTAAQHEAVRAGTSLARTIQGLRALRRVNSGNVLVWSTLREEQSLLDCFRQFMEMRSDGLADHYFWHWADTTHPFEDLANYAGRYEQDLEQIMSEYTSTLAGGRVLPIAHINELLLYSFMGRQRGHTACAVETSEHFDILGGRVHACADLPESFGAYSAPGEAGIPVAVLQSLVAYKKHLGCNYCEAHWYCGGRCPVQAMAGSEARTRQICTLMRIHVGVVLRHAVEIAKLMNKWNITHQNLYDSSAVMARYTDVVP
jgi:uncharacterized protein